LHPKAVHHHIGGLEKPETKHAEYYPVHHHIGGLENVAEAHSLFEDVVVVNICVSAISSLAFF
jgi:hypothetical protein